MEYVTSYDQVYPISPPVYRNVLCYPCLTPASTHLTGQGKRQFQLPSLSLSLSSTVGMLVIYSQIIYNFTEHEDNNMKLSRYDPWGQIRSSMTSRMTLSSKCPVKNPQCPPSTPKKDPHSWHTSNKDINTKLLESLPGGKMVPSMS